MPRSSRILLLLAPVAVSLLTQALPGRAQQPTPARYAFADTTLLRDTLGLKFDGLFPLADSLQITPDTLRALMIRYRLVMPRLVHLADSLSVPVDSVGPLLLRERFNPLARGGAAPSATDFTYSSGYDIQRTSTNWSNGSQYHLQRGPLYLNNATNIELQRITSAGVVNLRQNREATTEAGVTVSKRLSFGGRAYQLRFFSADPGAAVDQNEVKNEYGLTAHGVAGPRTLSSEINLRSGYLDDKSPSQIKRGLSSSADGRLRWQRGVNLSHDLSGSISGNASQTRRPGSLVELRTRDLSTNVRGNLSVAANAPVGLNVNYALRNTRVETPLDNLSINQIITRNNSADGTLRLRRDNDRYANVTGTVSRSASSTGSRRDTGGKGVLRWTVSGWALDASYSDTRSTSVYARQRGGGGYDDQGTSRNADGTLVRSFGAKIVTKLLASISLDRHRYVAAADSATPPSPRDGYRQSYRGELLYNQSQRLSSGLALEVSLNRSINISAATTGSNSDTREYRGEWRWNYRLFQSFTVSQNNQIVADYQTYPFAPARNSLSLNYNTITTMVAALPGGLSINVQHNTSQQPRGSYTKQPDGLDALQLSDDSKNYTLNASVAYRPFEAVGIHVEPRYQANDRSGTSNGVQSKQRADRRLELGGGVDLNLRVGRKGQLSGRVGRTYTDSRTTTYQDGIGTLTPRSETDFWNGSLQLSWSL
jgi:hypothetical protein